MPDQSGANCIWIKAVLQPCMTYGIFNYFYPFSDLMTSWNSLISNSAGRCKPLSHAWPDTAICMYAVTLSLLLARLSCVCACLRQIVDSALRKVKNLWSVSYL